MNDFGFGDFKMKSMGNINQSTNKNVSGYGIPVPSTEKKQSNAEAEPAKNLGEGPWVIDAGKKGNGGFTTDPMSVFKSSAPTDQFYTSKK